MKRAVIFFLSMVLTMVIMLPVAGQAYSGALTYQVEININGERINTQVKPFIKEGSTLVPLRGVVEKLGGQVEWVAEDRRVNVNYKDISISLQIDNNQAMVNGAAKSLEVAPIIHNDSTMIPVRFVAENMGMWVQWVSEARLVTITEPVYFDSLRESTVLGFTTNDYLGDNTPHQSLTKYYEHIDTVATFAYKVDSNGNLSLTGQPHDKTVEFAASKGIRPLMLVHNLNNGSFDRNISHAILSDEAKRSRLINNILVNMSKEKYSGVNIDIENIYWYDRQGYSTLIKELKEKLTPYGFYTTVSIPAKTYDSYLMNNWSGAFDYKEIGKYADRILLMTYDEHYSGGNAGPVASLPWVEGVIKYAVTVIPPNKLLLGISAYGYDWWDGGSKTVKFNSANSLISSVNAVVQWEDNMQVPYFKYYKNGTYHEVWYENLQSLSAKLDLVKKYSLGGIGIWKLGYDDESFWSTIREKIMNIPGF